MPVQKTTKEEIIKSSILTFREKGYYRTSMADLSVNAGLTKGSFYHHFKNKEDVMLKSLEALHSWFNNKIFRIAYDETISKKARIVKMGDRIMDAFSKSKGGCFFANTILETAPIESTFMKEVDSFFQDWEKAFTHLLGNDKEAEMNAQTLIGDIEGAIIMMQLRNDKKYLKNAINRTIEAI